MFVGRQKELSFLNERYEKTDGQFIVLYGRRRIGKTELLKMFSREKEHIFYLSKECSDQEQLNSFSKRVLSLFKGPNYLNAFNDWETVFDYIADYDYQGKKILIIDEFPYMVKGNQSIPSMLQHLWDHQLKDQNIMLVLCGSSMSFMENEILGEKNPLYGRMTGIYKLLPLQFKEVLNFYKDMSFEDAIIIYSILGGVPHYLKQFDANVSLVDNIKKNILSKGVVLYSEVEFLLKQELRETANYNSIISVVAAGNTKHQQIHQKTGMDKAKVSVYLKNLMDLGIIVREFPITEKDKAKVNVQRGLYRLSDYYFTFWYRFVYPYLSELEDGEVDNVYEQAIEPYMSQHVSYAFEDVCIEYLKLLNQKDNLPFKILRFGRWWDKQEEIDVVGYDLSGRYIFGECKWRNSPVSVNVLRQLEDKAGVSKTEDVHFYLFSKSGFKANLIDEVSHRDDVTLISLDDLELTFRNS